MIQLSPGGVAVQVTARVLWLCVWLVRPSVHPPAPVLSHFSSFRRPPVAGPSSLRPRGCLCLAGRCGCCAVCPVRVQFECAGVVSLWLRPTARRAVAAVVVTSAGRRRRPLLSLFAPYGHVVSSVVFLRAEVCDAVLHPKSQCTILRKDWTGTKGSGVRCAVSPVTGLTKTWRADGSVDGPERKWPGRRCCRPIRTYGPTGQTTGLADWPLQCCESYFLCCIS